MPQAEFGVSDHRKVYTTSGLLTSDEMHVSQSREKIFVQDLAGQTYRALNYPV